MGLVRFLFIVVVVILILWFLFTYMDTGGWALPDFRACIFDKIKTREDDISGYDDLL